MATKDFKCSDFICSEGDTLDNLYVISSGSVNAAFPGGEVVLKKGDVIGLPDIAFDSHFFTYAALEDTSVIIVPVFTDNLNLAVSSSLEISRTIFNSMLNQMVLLLTHYRKARKACDEIYEKILSFYSDYSKLCIENSITPRALPQFDDFRMFETDVDLEQWLISYYAAIYGFQSQTKQEMFTNSKFLIGFLNKASRDIHSMFDVCRGMADYKSDALSVIIQKSRIDLFDLYTGLLFRLHPDDSDYEITRNKVNELTEIIQADKNLSRDFQVLSRIAEFERRIQNADSATVSSAGGSNVSSNYHRELSNSLDTILEFSGVNSQKADAFRNLIYEYKKSDNKTSSNDEARMLRVSLTNLFNEIYATAFLKSLSSATVPTLLKMFFNFGYVDEELAGIENATYLYTLADNYTGDATFGIYTLYEWLTEIYFLRKNPSRNEFDTDFVSYLHEQKISGKITDSEEKQLLSSSEERVKYELQNVFPVVNKVTYGRISSYCPVFSEHNVIKPLPSCLVTVDTVIDGLQKINRIDYGAFYRETLYSNPAIGINKEYLYVKIPPDIILFPNMGTRAVMWQEIDGSKRTTPARFMISAFHIEDINNSLTRVVGEYRWEMCKRIQGSRWNDVSDHSLTSEYFDYAQFFRKNNDLSADAKEKVRNNLLKSKNSFKEMFIRDYMSWVLFESEGSPRLNKVVRQIMCTYCPFPASTRQRLCSNPMYREVIEHHELNVAKQKHHFDNVLAKLNSTGLTVPNEILAHVKYIEG